MKQTVLLCLFAGVSALAVLTAGAEARGAAIKKCQDASGRWHYGDTAAEACADSKITVINQQGVKTKEIEPPPTKEDRERDEARRAEAIRAEEQAKRDELLLGTYAHEADILYIRDRKLAQVEATIKASTDTLKPLRATLERLEQRAAKERNADGEVSDETARSLQQTRSQIEKHEAAIERRREEQALIKAQAEQDLERYRELKGQPAKEADAGR